MARITGAVFTETEIEYSQSTPINQIDEFVYLGNVESRRHVTDHGISFVIRLTTEVEAAETRIDLPEGVRERVFYISDEPTRLITDKLLLCIEFIREHTTRGKKVLVHCEMGISRSASVVIAWIMYSRKLAALDAMRFVESKRPCIWPNLGFWRELTELTFE